MGFAVGSSGTILKTTNSGSTWTTLPSRTINNLYTVNFADTTIGFAVGENGTILNTNNSGGFPVGLNDFSLKGNRLKIFPSPANSKINVALESSSTICQLFLLNMSGQTLIISKITGPSATIDISTLPSGVYLVKVIGDKDVHVGKFVKQ
jgi:hypothetical protein